MKHSWLFIPLLLLSTYSKGQYLDQIRYKLHPVSDLKKDIKLVKITLEKNDPNLYLYISQKKLNYKFDSLANSIQKPLTTTDFYPISQ